MPRPERIAQIHKALYDLRWAEASRKEEFKKVYDAQLRAAATHYDSSIHDLRMAICKDFGLWVKENKLPAPPLDQPDP